MVEGLERCVSHMSQLMQTEYKLSCNVLTWHKPSQSCATSFFFFSVWIGGVWKSISVGWGHCIFHENSCPALSTIYGGNAKVRFAGWRRSCIWWSSTPHFTLDLSSWKFGWQSWPACAPPRTCTFAERLQRESRKTNNARKHTSAMFVFSLNIRSSFIHSI